MDANTNQPMQALDLRQAVIQMPLQSGALMQKAATVLVEEVEKRTRLRWSVRYTAATDATPVIALLLADPEATLPADGFQISTQVEASVAQVQIVGNDARGLLFGVGYLLRHLQMKAGAVTLPQALNRATAPHYALRGHQLGYRDKTNAYDGWDLPQWDQYLRELAIFGTNAIELIPPRSDDRLESVHFPLPPLEMMVGMSRIADEYGLAVWIWYPALDEDYSRPEMIEFALNEWGEIYRRLPRIDAILVPGGDPGNTRPRYLLPMLAQQTTLLKQYHPNAQMWISAQGFSQEWLDEFITILQTGTPAWLSGVVYGPWCHMTLREFRRLIPAQYPVRHYPDITHSLDCQYPVPEWDIAFALTEGRETINPRPRQEKIIFDQMGDAVIGFLTYSEGCNDDVNKFIWSGLGWDPQTDVVEILRQYSRFFIGAQHEHDFTEGLLALEQNWVGPLAVNSGVHTTLQQFQALERAASPALRKNWRFQMVLFRAYYDGYVRSRLLYERGLEEQALDVLRQAPTLGAFHALERAETLLNQFVIQPIAGGWRTRLFQLAEALFQSVHMQLSVVLYDAQSEVRGASLDGVDYPLNDRPWLLAQFQQIRTLLDESARLAAIHRIVTWTDPGPGGYYIDLSNAYDCPYLLDRLPYADDPGFYRSPHRRFPYWKDARPFRRAWRAYTGCLADFPFRLHFPRLDPDAGYQVQVVYSDTEENIKVRLSAVDKQTGDEVEIHPFQLKPFPPQPQTFAIPRTATSHGALTLSLQREPGLGGLGAGHEISEIWIIETQQRI
ncbi:MAG: hypothetical protein DYG89_25580 [Caldilinea sp. CFX5]|nr:hypothetical protein [Caldilinea sp. CFX5]